MPQPLTLGLFIANPYYYQLLIENDNKSLYKNAISDNMSRYFKTTNQFIAKNEDMI